MSMDIESAGKIEQAKRAVGSILNLINYEPVASLEEARTRLRLAGEFAMEAFQGISEVEEMEFPGTERAGTPERSAIYAGGAFAETTKDQRVGRGNLGILQ